MAEYEFDKRPEINLILQMTFVRLKFPLRWLQAVLTLDVTPSLSFSVPSCPSAVISAKTRSKECREKHLEEPWRSRTCKWLCSCTTFFLVCVLGVGGERDSFAWVRLTSESVCKYVQVPCVCASIFHCVKCHVLPVCCIDGHRCSLTGVRVCVWH